MNQINKQALHPKNDGWYVEQGKNISIFFFNGLLIGEVIKLNNQYFVGLYFPTSKNSMIDDKHLHNYPEAEAYIKEMFEDFLRIVNEKPRGIKITTL